MRRHWSLLYMGYSQDKAERCERAELEHVFDDGRDSMHAYCACLRFTPAEGEKPPERA